MALKNYDVHLYDEPQYKKMVHYIPISLKPKTLQIYSIVQYFEILLNYLPFEGGRKCDTTCNNTYL